MEFFMNITHKWLDNKSSKKAIIESNLFIDRYGRRFFVDGKYVVLDYSRKEKEVARWLVNTFGGQLYLLPKINKPEGIQTADYLYRGEFWDLKEISGSGKNVFFHAIEKHEKQSHNFIFDISNSCLSNQDVYKRLNSLYSLNKVSWLDKIIIKRNNELVLVSKK